MAKLKTLLAKKLPEWPEGVVYIEQTCTGALFGAYDDVGKEFKLLEVTFEKADDWIDALVTRAEWQAERARLLLDNQPERDPEIKELVELACGQKKLPYAFTEADIRAAFEAGATWMRGAVEAGAAEYVDKLKGLK